MKTIQNTAAFAFIIAVAILSVISVFGIWDIVEQDVIGKSFLTLFLLAFVASIIMVAGRFMEGHANQEAGQLPPEPPHPAFSVIRKVTLSILIGAVSLLALLGVMAIWEVIDDKDVLYKSLGSLVVLAFGAFIMVMTCRERENAFVKPSNKHMSVGSIILILILLYFFFAFIGNFY